MNTPILVAVLAIVAGPLVAYVTANRRLSGKIATSEAADLWAESSSIRDDYRARISTLEARVETLEQKNTELERANDELRRAADELRQQLEGSET